MAEPRIERRLATILMADVVGYSRLIGEDEAGTLAVLKDRRKNILVPLVSEHAGRIVKFMGDGVLIEFASAFNAVRCGLAVQSGMARANADMPEHRQIVLRIGINIGDIIVEGSDIFGDGVNIAARLEALAKPGELCIAGNVYDTVRGKLSIAATDLGEVALKNIVQLVKAYRLVADPPAAAPKQPEATLSIAVLPFDNLSGIPEQDYIGDGISENLITDLARFRDLVVIARNSSFSYRGKATRIQEISRDLSVNYVLEGSVQKAGDRIRITAQLIEGASGKHIWAERYDRRIDDLFAVMDEITQLIVGTLATTYGGRLRRPASQKAIAAGPTSFLAFDHFVQGMQQLNKFTRDSVALALDHFAKAIAINPHFAKVHAKIAWGHLITREAGWSADPEMSGRLARQAADAAIRADDSEAWAHWALAGCALFNGEYDRSLDGMRRAIELNPNDADVLADMGLFYAWAGYAEEGLSYALKAMRINPHYPEYYADQLGQIYFAARQYENAIRTIEGIRNLVTKWMLAFLAASHAALGNQQAARAAVDRLLIEDPRATASHWASTAATPYRLESDREHLGSNLLKAGLPP